MRFERAAAVLVKPIEYDAAASEFFQVRTRRPVVTIQAEPVGAQGIDRNENYVRVRRGVGTDPAQEYFPGDSEEPGDTEHHDRPHDDSTGRSNLFAAGARALHARLTVSAGFDMPEVGIEPTEK